MKRYDVTDFGQSMGEFDDGEWVKYDDMEDLVEAAAAVVEDWTSRVFLQRDADVDKAIDETGRLIKDLRIAAEIKAPPADDDGGEADRAHAKLGDR